MNSVDVFVAEPMGVGRFALAESPVVDDDAIVFVDLEGGLLLRLDRASGRLGTRRFDQRVCCAVPVAAGGQLVAVETHLEFIGADGERVTVSDALAPGVRFNDGKCDAHGHFLVGVTGLQRETGQGSLCRFVGDRRLVPLVEGLTLPNGLGWSLDGRRLYLVESVQRAVLVYRYDEQSGVVGDLIDTIDLSAMSGYPDGLAVDSEGNLWIAFWAGGTVRRLTTSGDLIGEIRLPVEGPSSCAFVGRGELLVTTSSDDDGDPHSGDLFRATVPADGAPVHAFSGFGAA